MGIPYNSQQPLLAGEYLMASFPVRPIKNVMEIPRSSVFNSNEVFIIKEGRLAKKEINIVKINERTLIFNGLTEGDSVVVQQLINVSEGTLVQVGNDQTGQPGMDRGNPGQESGVSGQLPAESGNQNIDKQENVNRKAKRKSAERS